MSKSVDKQQKLIEAIDKHSYIFAIGKAGTGKTFIATSVAFNFLKKGLVKKLVITRPAISAGEDLGFLPGDLQEKVYPFLRPIYDSILKIYPDHNIIDKMIKDNQLEIAPLAFMRGRTFEDAFVIADECQNITREQMQMLLTRLGKGKHCKMVLTGDLTQTDIKDQNGLWHSLALFGKKKGFSVINFHDAPIMRHKMVEKIIDGYAKDSGEYEIDWVNVNQVFP